MSTVKAMAKRHYVRTVKDVFQNQLTTWGNNQKIRK